MPMPDYYINAQILNCRKNKKPPLREAPPSVFPVPSLGKEESAVYMQSESERSPMIIKTTQHRLKHSELWYSSSIGASDYFSGSDERTMSLL